MKPPALTQRPTGVLHRQVAMSWAVPRKSWVLALLGLMLAACAASIALAFATVPFTRFVADDWMFWQRGHRLGIVGAAQDYYLSWGGRFTSNTLNFALTRAGTWISPSFSFAMLTLWLGVGHWSLRQILRAGGASVPRYLPLLLEVLLSGFVFEAVPHVGQNFFWLSGTTTYTLPLICLAGTFGLVAQSIADAAPPMPLRCALVALLCFAAAGCSELVALVQGAALAAALVASLVALRGTARRRAVVLLLCALGGATAGLALTVVAPGNAARGKVVGGHRTIDAAVRQAWGSSSRYCMGWIRDLWLLLAAFCATCGVFVESPGLRPARAAVLAAVSGVVVRGLLFVASFPPTYAMGIGPPARAQIVLHTLILAWAAAAGLLLGTALTPWLRTRPLSQRPLIFGAATVVLLWLGNTAPHDFVGPAVVSFSKARAWSARWDAREAAPAGSQARLTDLGAWGEPDYPAELRARDEYLLAVNPPEPRKSK